MKSDVTFFIEVALAFLPFLLFALLNGKANVAKEFRSRQYPMPFVAILYGIILLIFRDRMAADCMNGYADFTNRIAGSPVGLAMYDLYVNWDQYLSLVLFNTEMLLQYLIVKRALTAIFGKIAIRRDGIVGFVVELFYNYNEQDNRWYIRDHYKQARTYLKTAYFASCATAALALLISCVLCMKRLIDTPFSPIFPILFLGEVAFFIDGISADERKPDLKMQSDNSRRIAMYPLLRKPLKSIFGDKLSADGTTMNDGGMSGGAVEDILVDLEKNGGHVGKNYSAFIRKKMDAGLKPNVDYVRCGYDLSVGKSLLFNTPFYDKLSPYVFYAMNRELLTGGKVLIVLGRHGTQEDLCQWARKGMQTVSNVPDLWNVSVLSGKKTDEEEMPDIGIISRSGVHDLDIHKNNLSFLGRVSFVVLVEPSRLVTTAQIGLNLLIKCCGKERAITFCSVDRNCDGLVDALSHILMTNITEVSATEYPAGMSSYMYWTADNDYLQHRILPGVSRYLGMGTELSMVALKNQVKNTVWYGGEAFPVLDARWIAKQYYYDLLDYAQLPTNQETFDKCFQTSFNMCNEKVSDFSFITVEDDRNNLFETRRNFATIAQQQGFVNVISSEYMLREYMSENTELFTADAKAIPYITADYARTKRNAILSLCLLLCIDSVQEDVLHRQLLMQNLDTEDPATSVWQEVCQIFGNSQQTERDKKGNPILCVTKNGKQVTFRQEDTIRFKRAYSVESGKFESVYTIEDQRFAQIILDDLQNASYIAEQESKDIYIGTELKGHVYQKYMPGQFFTLNGKYYEMISTATDNRILVRRASEHIGGRLAYRQVRNYTIHNLEDSNAMGALKSVNNIDIHYQYADFSVQTPGYWKLDAYNNFDNGQLIQVNGVPERTYHHKQILKFDFSKLGDAFTDSVRMTLTNLLNEIFVTLFADNQPFISAITPGQFDAPITYSLTMGEGVEASEKCIYIMEDSQLDIGLLIAVERNANRIFQIMADYLNWNEEQIAISMAGGKAQEPMHLIDPYEGAEQEPKKGFFKRIGAWFKNLFKRKKKTEEVDVPAQDYMMIYGKPHKLVNGKWVTCSQEEFDAKMAERRRAIEERKQQQAAQEESEQETPAQPEESEQEATAEELPEEPQVPLSPKEQRKAEKAAKRAAKEEAKAAKRAAKEAKKAGKEQPAEDIPAAEEVPAAEAEPQLSPKEQRKAAKAEAKAAKRAAKEEAKAAKRAAKEAQKAGNEIPVEEAPEEEIPESVEEQTQEEVSENV